MASGGGRCWVVYNEALVKRVVMLFSFDCLDRWYEELRSMNVCMVGVPSNTPHSFIANMNDIGGYDIL